MNVTFCCNFPLPAEMLEKKATNFCKKFTCNKTMLWYFNISVLSFCFSFGVAHATLACRR